MVGGGPEFRTSAVLTTTHRNSPDPGPRNFRWLNLGSIDRKRDEKRGAISAVRFLSPRQGDEAIPDISRSSERKGAFSRALAAATLLANRPIRSQLITAALAGLAIVIIAFVTREQLAEHVAERVRAEEQTSE